MNTWQEPPRQNSPDSSQQEPHEESSWIFNLFLPERSEMMDIGGEFSGSYYDVLGVGPYSSLEEIRRAYRKLAMKWHPDRWTRRPSMFAEAKRKFQIIQEAYEVLSDDRKRVMYNAGMYNPNEEESEGFCDFVQEMMSLVAQSRAEKQEYSLEDLQRMLMEMAQGFDFPQCPDFELPTTTFDYLSRPESNCIWVGGGTTTTGPSHHLHASSSAAF